MWSIELTEGSGTGIHVPSLPKCLAPVIPAVCLGTYRTERTFGTSNEILAGRTNERTNEQE